MLLVHCVPWTQMFLDYHALRPSDQDVPLLPLKNPSGLRKVFPTSAGRFFPDLRQQWSFDHHEFETKTDDEALGFRLASDLGPIPAPIVYGQ